MYDMKRTTIFADESLLKLLKRIAKEDGVSVSSLIRMALERFIADRNRGKLPSFVGKYRSGHKDTSTRVDEILGEIFAKKDPHD